MIRKLSLGASVALALVAFGCAGEIPGDVESPGAASQEILAGPIVPGTICGGVGLVSGLTLGNAFVASSDILGMGLTTNVGAALANQLLISSSLLAAGPAVGFFNEPAFIRGFNGLVAQAHAFFGAAAAAGVTWPFTMALPAPLATNAWVLGSELAYMNNLLGCPSAFYSGGLLGPNIFPL
jgi:hypothetical protein